ncbi:MAG TPA: type II toxin-antitoxin system RelE/ParE family toxin [Acidobacteria bacterium]|nr:type II toxin-antitoxin system RelE/ParE family toxin [Acidobacteriota bacterium]
MASYSLWIKASAAREIEAIEPPKVRRQVVRRIQRISENPRPHGCEKLGGQANRYRVRQGDYRIVYSVQDRILTVVVVKVGHRRDVYRHL